MSAGRSPRFNADADGLGAYLQFVCAAPILTVEHERELAALACGGKNRKATDRLVLANMRFVVSIARRYQGYGLPLADLIQEGSIGLITAVRRFDPKVGVRLISYAVHWIRAEMHEYILRNFRIVRHTTTHAQRKLFFNLRKLRPDSRWLAAAEAQAIADQLDVSKEEVLKAEAAFFSPDQSFNSDADGIGPESWLMADNADPARIVEQADWQSFTVPLMSHALRELDARSQDIVRKRVMCDGRPVLLIELGAKYGISAERVRQIENSAIGNMRYQLAPSVEAGAAQASN